jgi:hypothetical protein
MANNDLLYNAAVAGCSASQSNRSPFLLGHDYGDIVLAINSFATILDDNIPTEAGGADTGQARLLSSLCESYWGDRFPIGEGLEFYEALAKRIAEIYQASKVLLFPENGGGGGGDGLPTRQWMAEDLAINPGAASDWIGSLPAAGLGTDALNSSLAIRQFLSDTDSAVGFSFYFKTSGGAAVDTVTFDFWYRPQAAPVETTQDWQPILYARPVDSPVPAFALAIPLGVPAIEVPLDDPPIWTYASYTFEPDFDYDDVEVQFNFIRNAQGGTDDYEDTIGLRGIFMSFTQA